MTGVPVLPSVTLSCVVVSYLTASATVALVAASCDPFTASVLDMLTSPAFTFVIFRWLVALPTETVFAWSATEPAPSATELAAETDDFEPSATAFAALVTVPEMLTESLEPVVPAVPYGLNANELAELVTEPPFGAKKTVLLDAASIVTAFVPPLPMTIDEAAPFVMIEPIEKALPPFVLTLCPIAVESAPAAPLA